MEVPPAHAHLFCRKPSFVCKCHYDFWFCLFVCLVWTPSKKEEWASMRECIQQCLISMPVLSYNNTIFWHPQKLPRWSDAKINYVFGLVSWCCHPVSQLWVSKSYSFTCLFVSRVGMTFAWWMEFSSHILSPVVCSPWLESFSLFAHKCNHPQPAAACPKHTTVV